MVEAGTLNGPEAEKAISESITPLLDADADVLVLGCTHYPFLSPVIKSQLPAEVSLIDTGVAVAKRVKNLLPGELPATGETEIFIETTGSLEHLDEILPKLLPGITAKTAFCLL